MDAHANHGVMKVKMLSLVAEFSPQAMARALAQQAGLALAGFDFEARLHDSLIARVTLDAEGIGFESFQGIHGRLFPEFSLDPESLVTSLTGQPVDVAGALRLLRVGFRAANDVRIVEDRDDFDEETFIVDPDTLEAQQFEHQT